MQTWHVPNYAEIKALEVEMLKMPQLEAPVIHRFAHALYSRELAVPKDSALVGRMHARSHFFVLLSGEITAWTDHGMERMKAPQLIRTEPGTKRVIYAHEDSVMVTFHGTDATDPDAAEDYILVPEPNEQTFLLEHTE